LSNARPASPFDAIRRTAHWGQARREGGPASKWERGPLRARRSVAKKNSHRRPSRQTGSAGLDGRRICTRTLG